MNVAKAHGKIDPGDFASVVSFLTRRIIDNRLSGDLFTPAGQGAKKANGGKRKPQALRKKPQKARRGR